MNQRLKVVIAHQTVVDGDAIGHDILGMYQTLTNMNYEVFIYAENYLGDFERYKMNEYDLLKYLKDKKIF